MRKIINIVLVAASLVLMLGLVLAIGAQTEEARRERRGGMNIDLSGEEISRLVEIIRIWKIADELELNEEQLTWFLPKFKQLRDMRSRYYRTRRDGISELGKLLEAKASEEKLKSVVDEYRDSEVGFYREYGQLQDTLNSKLTVKQQASYIVFEDKYRDDIRRLIRTLRELSEQRKPLPPQPVPLKKQE